MCHPVYEIMNLSVYHLKQPSESDNIFLPPKELQLRHRGLAQGDCVAKAACPGDIEERLRDSTSGSPAEDGSTSGVSSGEPDETDRRETRDDIQPGGPIVAILSCIILFPLSPQVSRVIVLLLACSILLTFVFP